MLFRFVQIRHFSCTMSRGLLFSEHSVIAFAQLQNACNTALSALELQQNYISHVIIIDYVSVH